MKKICAVFALFCVVFLFAACSGGSKESVYGDTDTSDSTSDKTDSDTSNINSDDADSQSDSTADTMPDNGDSADNSDSDKPDSDNPDTTPDGGDTAPDNGDTEPDNGDSADDADTSDPTDDTDSSDSQSDDDADTSDSQPEHETGETREADCTGLPANASWNTVSSITQTWNGNEWTPSTEAVFSTTSSSTKCRFVCNQNYEWNDSECVAGTRTANCEGLPENAVWNGAASITQTWDDENWVPSNTGTYNKTPNSSECRFQCADNYNWTGSQCVAATIQTDCTGLPENALWNTVSNITQSWSGTAWTPSEVGTFNETPSYSECRFVCKTNYSWNGIACAPNELPAVACTGKPENAVWNSVSNITQTWNGNEWVPTTSATFNETPSTTECRFKCADNFDWNGLQCAFGTRNISCTGLPANAEWNSVSEISQTWSGNAWIPSNTGSFNSSASQSECYFKCKEHYTWNNTVCEADTQPATCTGLPENAVWNSVSEITQTWNGNGWIPSNIGTYNASASLAECRFKCKDHYSWNSSTSTCVADTQPANCTGLPANASWNTASSITQTWDGNAWIPSNAGTYNETPSSNECHYKCNQHYTWNASTSTCVADTQSANCMGLPTNAVWNTASSITQTWNGNGWIPSNTGTYNETPSSNECHYKCDSDYHWENSACISNTRTANCTDLPANSVWNTASSITQNWSSANGWQPSTAGTYSATPSTNQCYYKCASGYTRENDSCINQKTASCTDLPDNAQWNTASTITQNWDGNTWTPTTTGSFSSTPSATECKFKCKTNYTWNQETSTCKADSKVSNCTDLPANAEWNTASTISQTWDGSSWQPSTTGVFSAMASTKNCYFKCKTNYTWQSSSSTCQADSKVSNCTGLPSNAKWNTVSSITQTWDGSTWAPSTTGTYNETASTTECLYKCKSGYYWNGSVCRVIPTLGKICTGQAKCYNNSEEITCPTSSSADFYGQDAQYRSKCIAQSFSASSKVVVDNNTGLTWEKSPSSSTYTWGGRNNHCSELNSSNYGGKSNWRVPNPLELLTIVNNSRYNPATNSNFTGIPTDTNLYLWTNNEYKFNTNLAYLFNTSHGSFTGETKHNTYKVLCVSGEEMRPAVSSDFTTSSDGKTVTDNRTGLMWQKEYVKKTWQQALKYCEDSTYAGYSDWKLPNKHELASLMNYEKSGSPYSYFPGMPTFPDMPSSAIFRSSSTDTETTSGTWYVNFDYGDMHYSSWKTSNNWVRCVRNAE